MKILDWLKWKISKPRFNKRTFSDLVKKHGLEGKIDLRESTQDGYTLTPIISAQGEASQIPGEFLREFLFLIFKGENPWYRNWGFLKVGQPRTLQSIQKEIDAWNTHCELAWQAMDG